jgi:hypothetical protein
LHLIGDLESSGSFGLSAADSAHRESVAFQHHIAGTGERLYPSTC